MSTELEYIITRVQEEGKDSLLQHTAIIEQMVRDITREITAKYQFHWLIYEYQITSLGDGVWVSLDPDIRDILGVESDDRRIDPISEKKYFFNKSLYKAGSKSLYRNRWNKLSRKWEMTFINVDSGTIVNVLGKNLFDDPEKLPDEFEEALVVGSVYKYLLFLEGDDTTVSDKWKARYDMLVAEYATILDDDTQDDEDDRVMTNEEIEDARNNFYENDPE